MRKKAAFIAADAFVNAFMGFIFKRVGLWGIRGACIMCQKSVYPF